MDRSREKQLLEYHRTLHGLDADCLASMPEAHCIKNKYRRAFEQMKPTTKCREKIF